MVLSRQTPICFRKGERGKKNGMAIGVTGGQPTFHWSPRLLANKIVREVAPMANNFFTAQNTHWCRAWQCVIAVNPKATSIWTFVNKVNGHRRPDDIKRDVDTDSKSALWTFETYRYSISSGNTHVLITKHLLWTSKIFEEYRSEYQITTTLVLFGINDRCHRTSKNPRNKGLILKYL